MICELCFHHCDFVERFGNSYDSFSADPVYRNAVSLCILQIGEMAGNLSEEFRQGHPAIPWRQIKLMRNIVAHRYGMVDHTITWDVEEHDTIFLDSVYTSRVSVI